MATSGFFGLVTSCRIDPFDFRLSIYYYFFMLLPNELSFLSPS